MAGHCNGWYSYEDAATRERFVADKLRACDVTGYRTLINANGQNKANSDGWVEREVACCVQNCQGACV